MVNSWGPPSDSWKLLGWAVPSSADFPQKLPLPCWASQGCCWAGLEFGLSLKTNHSPSEGSPSCGTVFLFLIATELPRGLQSLPSQDVGFHLGVAPSALSFSS